MNLYWKVKRIENLIKENIKNSSRKVFIISAPLSKSWSFMEVKRKLIPMEEESKDVHKISILFEKIRVLVGQCLNALVFQKSFSL